MGENDTDPGDNAPQLFAFFFFSVIMFFGFLRTTKGNPAFIDVYIASRKWEFLADSATLERFLGIIKFIIWILLSMPFLSLIIWSAVLLYMARHSGKTYIIGISAFLIGTAVITCLASVFNISW